MLLYVSKYPLLTLTQHSFSQMSTFSLTSLTIFPQLGIYKIDLILSLIFLLKLNFDLDRGVFPMVIQAVVDEGDGRLPELRNINISFPPRLALET